MTTFRYQAYDTTEKKISGSINAENKLEVIEILKNLNLVPIKIVETKVKISQIKIICAIMCIVINIGRNTDMIFVFGVGF